MERKAIVLSVIIVNWNAKHLLGDCLTSLQSGLAGLAHEIIIVDNASTDGSAAWLKENFPSVFVIENPFNAGFARANNIGIRAGRGGYVLLINPDTIVLNKSALVLVEFLENHPEIDVVGPRILNPTRSVQYECARNFPTLLSEFFGLTNLDRMFPKNRLFGGYLMSYWDHSQAREVPALSWACFMIRRPLLMELLFDENFFMYAEDTDLFFRARQKGKKLFYLPQAQIIHIWKGSSSKDPYRMVVKERESMQKFFLKHYGGLTAGTYRIMVIIVALAVQLFCGLIIIPFFRQKKKIRHVFLRYNYMLRWGMGLFRANVPSAGNESKR